ncbi:succinylglutamate desuccinylase [Halotalea alkalilenta]|uniref:Succinylglutamate desuccinylase n=1 Tax=Halotalea alkalilenta TaxID=376489 RepID=A0A172YDA0_9GAMM|nr:succinylglutamate desuccinylase [Halotalea alkalilenta]ANF57072.1 hypothetical protein A5892_06000 [Halotalea alkalilenta]
MASPSLIDAWLDTFAPRPSTAAIGGALAGGAFVQHERGIFELRPTVVDQRAVALVISVGVHGDETAPIELLGETLSRLEAGLVRLGAPTLLLLGSPEAVVRATRYIDTNLNRLFERGREGMRPEQLRARELMTAVDRFFSAHQGRARLHLDLHTAIRESLHPRFAIEPFAATSTPAALWNALHGAGLQAGLRQHAHSWTFSHYSRHYHEAQGFTLELGRVAPFGANDLAPLRPLGAAIEAWIEGAPLGLDARDGEVAMPLYRVAREITREAEDFRFAFADDLANFSEFPPGALVGADAVQGEVRVGDRPQRVVFPNPRVELGARAGLLVERLD